MVCGLFSSFDPSLLESGIQLKWMWLGVGILLSTWQVFSLSTGLELFKKVLLVGLSGMINQSLGMKGKWSLSMLYSLFTLIMVLNLSGLHPFSVSLSSHLSLNLGISLPLWLSGMLMYLMFPSSKFYSHLVPMGSPLPLWPFLVLVELVSQCIRPFTLAVRLMANVMAGHLILSLVGEFGSIMTIAGGGVMFMLLQVGFIVFEMAVCIIQAYVFSSLVILYWEESVE